MITHGKKQISEIVYARKSSEGGGAVRLTNIIRGAQVVFGGMYPYWKLLPATIAAILAAFGQTDGNAVIKATNAYLNALAATDPTKASALAGFINEDPMLVCSLGLQPQGVQMPIRGLVGIGDAYINTGHIPTSQCIMEVKMANNTTNQWSSFGSRKAYCVNSYVLQENPSEYILFDIETTRHTTSIRPTKDVPSVYKIDAKNKKGYINGTEITIATFNGNTYPIYFFAINNNGGIINTYPSTYWYGKILDVTNHEYYPFTRQGANGMIDTITGTFHPNANTSGSFSIAYTLPDGTPWTPLNQQ